METIVKSIISKEFVATKSANKKDILSIKFIAITDDKTEDFVLKHTKDTYIGYVDNDANVVFTNKLFKGKNSNLLNAYLLKQDSFPIGGCRSCIFGTKKDKNVIILISQLFKIYIDIDSQEVIKTKIIKSDWYSKEECQRLLEIALNNDTKFEYFNY